jgi:hypothetical protein
MSGLTVAGCVMALALCHPSLDAQTPRLEYRVAFASAARLASQLESAGRDGFRCVAVARPDPGVVSPGLAVVLARATEGARPPVMARVVNAGYMGADLQPPLERAGAEGFQLCGVVLDESRTPPGLVAVLSQPAGGATPMRYGVEVLTNYKASIARLTTATQDGFVPVAATPISNNRVPDMRSWMVVTERRDTSTPRDFALRSGSGPTAIGRALNEQGKQGYRVDLIWKEGNDVVTMMSRPAGDAKGAHTYSVESRSADSLHFLRGLYLGDFAYLSSGDRLAVADTSQSASTETERDPLPKIGPAGSADAIALDVLGNHLSRHRGFAPVHVRISGAKGVPVLTTILSDRGK